MFYKKAQINQVFVYLVGFIIIGFAGFLVIKFISGISGDVEDKQKIDFFDNLKVMYNEVYSNWGAEKIEKLRVTNDIEYVCLIEDISTCDYAGLNSDFLFEDDLVEIFGGGDNVVVFSQRGVEGSDNLGEFSLGGVGCDCQKPVNSNVNFFIENNRNEVSIFFESFE